MSDSLTKYECDQGIDKLMQAEELLALVERIPDAKQIADQADAVRLYMKKATLGLENQNRAAAIAIKARKMAGQIAAKIERKHGANQNIARTGADKVFTPLQKAAKEAKVSVDTLERWQKLADSTTDAEIDAAAKEATEQGRELTTSDFIARRQATREFSQDFMRKINTKGGQLPGFFRRTLEEIEKDFEDVESLIESVPEDFVVAFNGEVLVKLAEYFSRAEKKWRKTWTR